MHRFGGRLWNIILHGSFALNLDAKKGLIQRWNQCSVPHSYLHPLQNEHLKQWLFDAFCIPLRQNTTINYINYTNLLKQNRKII